MTGMTAGVGVGAGAGSEGAVRRLLTLTREKGNSGLGEEVRP